MYGRIAALLLISVVSGFAQMRVGGFAEYDNITYLKEGKRSQVNDRNQSILQLELEHSAGERARLFSAVEIREDQDDRERNRVYLDEAYVDFYADDFDVRVGKQIFAWGRADGINPTDNLGAWDFSDVIDTDDEKIGLLAVRLSYYLGDWTVEGVLAPSFQASVLPGTDSRWWPEWPDQIANPLYPQAGGPLLDATYAFGQPVFPDEGWRATEYAMRAAGTRSGWDFSVSFFDGYDDLPALHVRSRIDSALGVAAVELESRYHRRRVLGGDFATAFGKMGLRGEAAYYFTADWEGREPAIDDPYLQYVLGIDYTFRELLAGRDLFALLQWAQEVQVPDRNAAYRITDLNHLFRRSLLGKTSLELGEYTHLTCQGVVNLLTDDWWIRPGLEWSALDGMILLLHGDLLGGPGDSFFGMFQDNRRIQIRLKYSF